MRQRYIGIIEGEGIGKEIVPIAVECLRILNKAFRLQLQLLTLEKKQGFTNFYHQIVNFFELIKKQEGAILRGPLKGEIAYPIRRKFDFFYKLIFLEAIPELQDISPLKEHVRSQIKVLLVRENNMGLYHGLHGWKEGQNGKIAFQHAEYLENKVEQIAKVAFLLASKRRCSLSLFIKYAALNEIGKLWVQTFERIQSEEYPTVSLSVMHPDRGAGELFSRAADFDVVVTLDVDGDILSDHLVALLNGSRAVGCSGEFDGTGFASYQTLHGEAVDIAGTGKANPVGMVLAAAMMLECSFGLSREAAILKQAVRRVLGQGFRTVDIATRNSIIMGTQEMGDLIVNSLHTLCATEVTTLCQQQP
jgi:3-isopropylmalate dehydrogenase